MPYQIHQADTNSSISLNAADGNEMLKITPQGFYVRGIKVPADDHEAETVYNSFKAWLTWAQLTRQ
jgi:hypothetical protein